MNIKKERLKSINPFNLTPLIHAETSPGWEVHPTNGINQALLASLGINNSME